MILNTWKHSGNGSVDPHPSSGTDQNNIKRRYEIDRGCWKVCLMARTPDHIQEWGACYEEGGASSVERLHQSWIGNQLHSLFLCEERPL